MYKIVSDDSIIGFEHKATQLMDQGYRPVGSLSVEKLGYSFRYTQGFTNVQ